MSLRGFCCFFFKFWVVFSWISKSVFFCVASYMSFQSWLNSFNFQYSLRDFFFPNFSSLIGRLTVSNTSSSSALCISYTDGRLMCIEWVLYYEIHFSQCMSFFSQRFQNFAVWTLLMLVMLPFDCVLTCACVRYAAIADRYERTLIKMRWELFKKRRHIFGGVNLWKRIKSETESRAGI